MYVLNSAEIEEGGRKRASMGVAVGVGVQTVVGPLETGGYVEPW